MQNMRVYLSGVNLFTFSPFKLWDPDLQTGATNYPNKSPSGKSAGKGAGTFFNFSPSNT